jgi:hypothetical protein
MSSASNGVQRAAEPHVVASVSEFAVSGESTNDTAGPSLRTPAFPLEPSSVPEEGHHDGHLGLVGCLVALTGLIGWLVVARPSGGYLLAVARRAVTNSGLGVGWAVRSGLPRAPVRLSLCVLRI